MKLTKLANLVFKRLNDRAVYFPRNWIQVGHLRIKLRLLLLTLASGGEKHSLQPFILPP